MARLARATVEIKDFPGLMSKMDPDDMPEGSAEIQVNVVSNDPATLVVRFGYRDVNFDS